MTAAYQVARNGANVYVRAHGLANMKNAPLLDAFVRHEMQLPMATLCVDLSACTGMDSTFMGLLVGTAGALGATGGKVVVVNPTEAGLKLLAMLGITEVLPVVSGCELPDLQFIDLDAQVTGTVARLDVIRKAHQSLSALNESNRAKFAAFLTALEADLAKQSTR